MLSAAARARRRSLVRAVLQVLVLGVRVDRGHQTLDDAEAVVQRLGHRRQAVRGAGGVGDDVVARRVVVPVVHAHHDGESSFLAGAEMITFLAPPSRWALALVASVKKPVDSMTTSAPISPHGSAAGSLSA